MRPYLPFNLAYLGQFLLVLLLLVGVGRGASMARLPTVSSTLSLDRRASPTPATTQPPRANTTMQDSDTAVTYMCAAPGTCTGVWSVDSAGEGLHYTSGPDTSLSVRFTGTRILMYGSQLTNGAQALAYVVFAGNSSHASAAASIDTRSSTARRSALLYTSDELALSTYRLVVEFAGRVGVDILAVDRFEVLAESDEDEDKDKPFPPAAAAAIGFGCALACIIVVAAIVVFLRRRTVAAQLYEKQQPQGTNNGAGGANNILSWWDFKSTQHSGRNGRRQYTTEAKPWMTFHASGTQLTGEVAAPDSPTRNRDLSSPLTPVARHLALPGVYGATANQRGAVVSPGSMNTGMLATPGHSAPRGIYFQQPDDRTPLSPQRHHFLQPPDAQRQPPTMFASAASIYHGPVTSANPRDFDSPVARWVAATSPFRTPSTAHPPPSGGAAAGTPAAQRAPTWLAGFLGRPASTTPTPTHMAQLTPLELPPPPLPVHPHHQHHNNHSPATPLRRPTFPRQESESPVAKWVQDTRRAGAPGSAGPGASPAPASVPRIVAFSAPERTIARARGTMIE